MAAGGEVEGGEGDEGAGKGGGDAEGEDAGAGLLGYVCLQVGLVGWRVLLIVVCRGRSGYSEGDLEEAEEGDR